MTKRLHCGVSRCASGPVRWWRSRDPGVPVNRRCSPVWRVWTNLTADGFASAVRRCRGVRSVSGRRCEHVISEMLFQSGELIEHLVRQPEFVERIAGSCTVRAPSETLGERDVLGPWCAVGRCTSSPGSTNQRAERSPGRRWATDRFFAPAVSASSSNRRV